MAISLAGAPAAADDAAELKGLLDAKSSSIVTLKTVVQMRIGGRGAGNEQEIESEVAGAMISPEGLVICSNMQLSGPASAVRRMLGGNMPGLNISSDVTSVKVVLGPDDEELDAKILARDEDLDLAWVQVEKPEKSFDAIDLKKSAEAELGERLVGVRRMGKMFDRTPVVALATVVGHLDRPRTLLVPQEELTPLIGLPVFNRTGDLVGIVVTQLPEAGDAAGGANPMTALLSMASSMQEGLTGLILPAAQVLRATERAQAGDGESEKPSEEAAAQ
ncbi:MAG: trypsin-like peptidase domain-containing protein [Pirellulales bacterium]|nr:trypsin-like peptidase domain-containing protein [Pirellulales bacterium]